MDKNTKLNVCMETKGFHVRPCPHRLALLTLVALFSVSGAWAAPAKLRLNLPADDVSTAILEFYHQTNIEVLYASTRSLKGIRTQAVVGEFDPAEALNKMLQGTGLEWKYDADGTVLILPEGSAGDRQASQADGNSVHHMAAVAKSTVPSDPSKLEEVVVTGTLIHGVLDVMAPLVYITKRDLQQASFATVQDALYQLPLNSLNGPREDLVIGNNLNSGSAINLRGLGVGATLVLVNGHRQPVGGYDGNFVDVSNIPWTAVERIEVLPDGSSALYGSDAIAGVVNIILRDNLRGAETQTRFGEAPDGAYEKFASQLFGTHWESGKAMFAYQYADRTQLEASDRLYTANTDKTSLGGSDHRSFYSNPANILNPATLQPLYGIPAGQDGTALTAGQLSSKINLQNRFADLQLFPERRSHGLFATASQMLGERAELFGEGRFTQRDTLWSYWPSDQLLRVPRTNPFFVGPFRGAPYDVVAYSFLRDLGANTYSGETRNYVGTLGAKVMLGSDWRGTLSETYGRQTTHLELGNVPDQVALSAALANPNPATAFNPFGDGTHTNPATIEAIRRTILERAVSDIQTASAVVDGPVFPLPGGAAKLAVGVEHRRETFYHGSNYNEPITSSLGTFGRNVESAFAELSLPIVGSREDPRAVPRLELTLAGRFEDYSDFGRTLNPQFRLRWVPLDSLKLRTSWGTSFRAPKLVDLYDSSNNADAMTVLPDPKSPTGRSLVLGRFGNNPNLKQETATTWTAGVDWVPMTVPGLKVSLTYYGIDYEGRIVHPGPASSFDILLQESEWAAVINRNPTRAQIDVICNAANFLGVRSDCLVSSPAAIVDLRLANLSTTKMNGLDLEANQSIDSRFGHFGVGLNGSYILGFDQAVTQTSASQSILDTVGNPLALRLRATAGWSRHGPDRPGLGVNLAVNHTGGYRNPASSLVSRVDPWTTFDAQLHYSTPKGGAWWDGTELSLNAVNVLNQTPPFVDNEWGYDELNVQPLGRVLSLYVRKNW